MDYSTQGQRDTKQIWTILAVIVVVVVIGLLLFWTMNYNGENKSVLNNKEMKPVIIKSEPSEQKVQENKIQNVDDKFVNQDQAEAFLNNVEAAVQLLTQYVNVLESDAEDIQEYWGKKKDSKQDDFEDELKDARKLLAEILQEWTELKVALADPSKQKQVYKRSSKISDKVKDVYKHVDDAQVDLLNPYRKIFAEYGKYSKNKSDQVYEQKVQPVVNALNNEFNLHKALIPTTLPPQEYAKELNYILEPLNDAVQDINQRTVATEAKITKIEKYYNKLGKNFNQWYKDNVKSNVIKYYH